MTRSARVRRWLPWLSGFVALIGLAFNALGIDMIVSLGVPPTRQWIVATYIYLAGFVLSLVFLVLCAIIVIKRRRRARSSSASAAV
jgi:hypothetical protein